MSNRWYLKEGFYFYEDHKGRASLSEFDNYNGEENEEALRGGHVLFKDVPLNKEVILIFLRYGKDQYDWAVLSYKEIVDHCDEDVFKDRCYDEEDSYEEWIKGHPTMLLYDLLLCYHIIDIVGSMEFGTLKKVLKQIYDYEQKRDKEKATTKYNPLRIAQTKSVRGYNRSNDTKRTPSGLNLRYG